MQTNIKSQQLQLSRLLDMSSEMILIQDYLLSAQNNDG